MLPGMDPLSAAHFMARITALAEVAESNRAQLSAVLRDSDLHGRWLKQLERDQKSLQSALTRIAEEIELLKAQRADSERGNGGQ